MLRVSSASFSRLQRRIETFTKPDRIEGAPFERDARDRSVPDRKLREQAENADEKPSETPLPGTTDHARSVSEPRGTRTRIAARSLRVRAQSTSIILARRIFARPAPLVSPSRARPTLVARASRFSWPFACFPRCRLVSDARQTRDSGVFSSPALVHPALTPLLPAQRRKRMPGEPLLPEGETPRETPLPEGVMDEIHRLREEHDRNASREKGVRSTRVRTDADRAKEKERSARRRSEQTD